MKGMKVRHWFSGLLNHIEGQTSSKEALLPFLQLNWRRLNRTSPVCATSCWKGGTGTKRQRQSSFRSSGKSCKRSRNRSRSTGCMLTYKSWKMHFETYRTLSPFQNSCFKFIRDTFTTKLKMWALWYLFVLTE